MAFACASPFSLYKLAFVRGILLEFAHVSTGHLYQEPWGAIRWIQLFVSGEVVATSIVIFALLGFAFTAADAIRKRRSADFPARLVICVWVAVYLLFLAFRIRIVSPVYALPVLPFVILLAVSAGARLIGSVPVGRWRWVVAGALSVLVVSGSTGIAERNLTIRKRVLTREQRSESVAAGRWLARS